MVNVPAEPADPDELAAVVAAVVLEQAAQQSASAAAAPTRRIFMSALLRDGHASAGPAVVASGSSWPPENVGDGLDQPADRAVMPGHHWGYGQAGQLRPGSAIRRGPASGLWLFGQQR